jgi:NAD(P)-dependent dehydrogenase (short-subunit alcohol dehydrogenase family)
MTWRRTLLAAGALAALGYRSRIKRPLADLRGKVALVSGGSRGLGLLIARELYRAGCRVALLARDADELEHARVDLAHRGADVIAVPCDVIDRRLVERALADVHARFGRIDVLVNNAGIVQVGPLESMTLDDFEHAMQTNFWGGVYLTLAVLPEMRARRAGWIVNVTSIGGAVAVPHLLPYDCAKFAQLGFSEGLRAELAQDGVSVTTVVPGLMRTGSTAHAYFKGRHQRELAWFQAGATTPLTSMNAARAAAEIVHALRRGEALVTLGWQARLLRLMHGLLPGLVADLLGQVNRVLPHASGADVERLAVSGRTLATGAESATVH